MILKCLPVGSMGANCYIIGCEETKEAAVIDPGGDALKILKSIKDNSLEVKYIINTHGHIDHILANDEVKEETGAKLLIHKDDAGMLEDPKKNLSIFVGPSISRKGADQLLQDGDVISVGGLQLEVLHTPGHTLGGICLKVEDLVFTGDTLFAESIGRSDFPGGCHETLISSIKSKLLTLNDESKVYPGHGPSSTIGHERENNPFF